MGLGEYLHKAVAKLYMTSQGAPKCSTAEMTAKLYMVSQVAPICSTESDSQTLQGIGRVVHHYPCSTVGTRGWVMSPLPSHCSTWQVLHKMWYPTYAVQCDRNLLLAVRHDWSKLLTAEVHSRLLQQYCLPSSTRAPVAVLKLLTANDHSRLLRQYCLPSSTRVPGAAPMLGTSGLGAAGPHWVDRPAKWTNPRKKGLFSNIIGQDSTWPNFKTINSDSFYFVDSWTSLEKSRTVALLTSTKRNTGRQALLQFYHDYIY